MLDRLCTCLDKPPRLVDVFKFGPLRPDGEPQANDAVEDRLRDIKLVAVLHQSRIQSTVQIVRGRQIRSRSICWGFQAEYREPEARLCHELECRRGADKRGEVLVLLNSLYDASTFPTMIMHEATEKGLTFRMCFWKPSTP